MLTSELIVFTVISQVPEHVKGSLEQHDFLENRQKSSVFVKNQKKYVKVSMYNLWLCCHQYLRLILF